MNNDISLKYKGKSVDDGSIDVDSLIYGLQGLVELSNVILNEYQPSKKEYISLRIKSFNKGSFETVLVFIEKHPTLIGNTTLIIVTVITTLAYYFTATQAKEITNNKEAERIVGVLISDDSLLRKTKGAFRNIALPLNEEGIISVDFGLTKSTEEIINKENKDCFLDKDMDTEVMHKTVTLKGSLRALDKKTLNGKFISDDKTYSISLIMESPEYYFYYFNKNNITISGEATCKKGSDEIIRIEIEKIY